MDRHDLARRGEDAAAAFLERVGMTVVERNWRCQAGEADIIATDGDQLVIVEVKTRRSERTGSPEEAVTPTKQRRIARIAKAYAAVNGLTPQRVRFDVITIRVLSEDRALLRHLRDAFSVEG
ncbi:MAG: YraN family protein [Coriobacteriia bacterium]|nr:YraN family protein [Coriobacteriia bacterium]